MWRELLHKHVFARLRSVIARPRGDVEGNDTETFKIRPQVATFRVDRLPTNSRLDRGRRLLSIQRGTAIALLFCIVVVAVEPLGSERIVN